MEVLLTQNKQLDLEQIKVMSQEDMFFLCSGASTEIQFRFVPLLWSIIFHFFNYLLYFPSDHFWLCGKLDSYIDVIEM